MEKQDRDARSAAAAAKQAVVTEARDPGVSMVGDVVDSERDMSLRDAFRLWPKAILFAFIISLTIIMEVSTYHTHTNTKRMRKPLTHDINRAMTRHSCPTSLPTRHLLPAMVTRSTIKATRLSRRAGRQSSSTAHT